MRRFADRDMMMRFYLGLGVGHLYAHSQATAPDHSAAKENREVADDEEPDMNDQPITPGSREGEDADETSAEESLDSIDDGSSIDGEDSEIDDGDLLAIDEIYNK
jgi:hypothetical protein